MPSPPVATATRSNRTLLRHNRLVPRAARTIGIGVVFLLLAAQYEARSLRERADIEIRQGNLEKKP